PDPSPSSPSRQKTPAAPVYQSRWPERTALPGLPGVGEKAYQPTGSGPSGDFIAPSGLRPSSTIGASTPIEGTTSRAGLTVWTTGGRSPPAARAVEAASVQTRVRTAA